MEKLNTESKLSIIDRNLCYWGAFTTPILGFAIAKILKGNEKYNQHVIFFNKGAWSGLVTGIALGLLEIFNII